MDCSSDVSFTIKNVPTWRRNVLDLLSVFYKEESAEHILFDVDVSWAKEQISDFRQANRHLTMTAILIKAIAMTQQNHPTSRTFYMSGRRSVTFHDITGGFTVERVTASGPAVFFGEIEAPQSKSLFAIAAELNRYHTSDIQSVPKLKTQHFFATLPQFVRRTILLLSTLVPSFRLQHMTATFGLSSLGSLGVRAVTGPPVCTSVFGVGAIEDRVTVINGEIVIRPMMTLSLNFDARIMNAFQAARFIEELRGLLENGWEESLSDSETKIE